MDVGNSYLLFLLDAIALLLLLVPCLVEHRIVFSVGTNVSGLVNGDQHQQPIEMFICSALQLIPKVKAIHLIQLMGFGSAAAWTVTYYLSSLLPRVVLVPYMRWAGMLLA